MSIKQSALLALVSGLALCSGPASAQTAPTAAQANPGVYKVLAENEQFRVLLATWKPGQKDVQHSHPPSAAYRLTDCKSRVAGPDGKADERDGKAGTVALQPVIPSHSFENIGATDCQVLIVERK